MTNAFGEPAIADPMVYGNPKVLRANFEQYNRALDFFRDNPNEIARLAPDEQQLVQRELTNRKQYADLERRLPTPEAVQQVRDAHAARELSPVRRAVADLDMFRSEMSDPTASQHRARIREQLPHHAGPSRARSLRGEPGRARRPSGGPVRDRS